MARYSETISYYYPETDTFGKDLFTGSPDECDAWVANNAEEGEDWFYYNGKIIAIR